MGPRFLVVAGESLWASILGGGSLAVGTERKREGCVVPVEAATSLISQSLHPAEGHQGGV